MGHFNSFFWGPRQYASLSTTVLTNLSYSDYFSACVRNWLHSESAVNVLAPAQTLNAEQTPSPDAVNYGRSVWYGYDDKLEGSDYFESATDNLPVSVGFLTSVDGSYHLENSWHNSLGYTTKRVEFGADANCNQFIKTNQYVYAANGIDLLKHIGPDGVVLESYAYDGYHQPLFMTNAVGEVTAWTYNGNGQVTSIKSPTGLITTNIYGSNGFLATSYDYSGSVFYGTNSYTYTNWLVYTHTDERGLTITNTWDKLQRLQKVAYPDGTSITYTHTNLDLVRIVDRMNFTNSFAYDVMQRKTNQVDALGRTTVYGYCACGLLDSIRDAAGNYTFFSYDMAGRLTNTAYADGYSMGRSYNLAGQEINTTDSSGRTVNNRYDPDGNLVAVTETLPDPIYTSFVGRVATYAYDIYDRMTNSVDANGVTNTVTYDVLGRIRTRSHPAGGTESFGYTLNVSGLTSYTNQLTNVTRYVFDPRGRKTAETNANLEVTQFAYNAAGDLLTLRDGKNQVTSWNYDFFWAGDQ